MIAQNVSDIFILQYRIDPDTNIPQISLNLEDIHLKVRYQVGDAIKWECTRDSKYMLSAIRSVAKAMRLKYYWVPLSTMLYIVMDNTGGHGTDACVAVSQVTLGTV